MRHQSDQQISVDIDEVRKLFDLKYFCRQSSLTIRHRFTGSTGRAYLFKKVVNLTFSNVQDRVMLTGRHMVRDVMCKNCKTKLGWMYEYATEDSQRYKEGRVILEHALITESEGFNEFPRPRNYEEN